MTVRHITVAGLLGAFLYVSQVVMSGLPNIHILAVLIIVYVKFLPKASIGAVAVFIILEGFSFGFGIWWLSYLYIWPLFALVVFGLRKWNSAWFWALIAGLFGLSFGALCAIPYLFIGGPSMAFSYWLAGLTFDAVHGAGNFLSTLLLYRPLAALFKRLQKFFAA